MTLSPSSLSQTIETLQTELYEYAQEGKMDNIKQTFNELSKYIDLKESYQKVIFIAAKKNNTDLIEYCSERTNYTCLQNYLYPHLVLPSHISDNITKEQLEKHENKILIIKEWFENFKNSDTTYLKNELNKSLLEIFSLFKMNEDQYLNKIKELVKKGANIHANHEKLLETVAGYGYIKIVDYLLDHHANPFINNNIVFRTSTEKQQFEVVKNLLNYVKNKEDAYSSICISAAIYNNINILKYIVEDGYNIIKDNIPLNFACEHANINIIKYLIEQGMDIRLDNNHALQIAAKRGYVEVVELLIENGADVEVAEKFGTKNVKKWSVSYKMHSQLEKDLINKEDNHLTKIKI